MNKKIIYFTIASVVSSYLVIELIISLFFKKNLVLFEGISLISSIICFLLVPILLAFIAKQWKLIFKKATLIYGIILLVTSLIQLIVIYFLFSNFTISTALLNVVLECLLPLLIFVIAMKVMESICQHSKKK